MGLFQRQARGCWVQGLFECGGGVFVFFPVPDYVYVQIQGDKGLSRIYLDNTFCDPRFQQPSREDVAAAISKRFRRKWPCIIFVESYRLGKETLLLHLAQKLRSRVLVSEERKKTMRACGFESDQVQIQSCDPLQASEDLLQTEALRGCIWAISRQNLRKGMWQASDSGCAFHGLLVLAEFG